MLNETVDSFQHAEIFLGQYKPIETVSGLKNYTKFPNYPKQHT